MKAIFADIIRIGKDIDKNYYLTIPMCLPHFFETTLIYLAIYLAFKTYRNRHECLFMFNIVKNNDYSIITVIQFYSIYLEINRKETSENLVHTYYQLNLKNKSIRNPLCIDRKTLRCYNSNLIIHILLKFEKSVTMVLFKHNNRHYYLLK